MVRLIIFFLATLISLQPANGQNFSNWSDLHDRPAYLATDGHLVVLENYAYLEQRDTTSEVFLYKLSLEGEILDSLVRGDFAPYSFYEQLQADPNDNTLWMIGFSYLLSQGIGAPPKLSVLHFDQDLNLINFSVNDTLADIFPPNTVIANNESSFVRRGDRIYARYYGFNLDNFEALLRDVVMDTLCHVLHTSPAEFPQPYATMEVIDDRLFGCFSNFFLELNPQNLEPIPQNSYDWLETTYNYNGFGFNNSPNFFPYFKAKDGNLVFANEIYSLNNADSAYQSIEIRTPDFDLVRRSVVHGLPIEGPNLEDSELRPAYRYPLDYNANSEFFLLGFDFANSNRWRLSKVDSKLAPIWDAFLMLPFENTRATGVVATPDGGCLVHGRAIVNDIFPAERRHILLKFDSDGEVTNTVTIGNDKTVGPGVYPNPCSVRFTLALPKAWSADRVKIEVFNLSGSRMLSREAPSGTEVTIPTSAWPNGIYWIRCQDQSGRLLGSGQITVSHP